MCISNNGQRKVGKTGVRVCPSVCVSSFFLSLTERNGRGDGDRDRDRGGFCLSVSVCLSSLTSISGRKREGKMEREGDKLQSFTLSLKSASISSPRTWVNLIITYTIEREIKVGTSPLFLSTIVTFPSASL